MTRKTIGILGGMGPRSTAPFLNLVIDECQRQYGASYDDEFPPIIAYSVPTPFYMDKPMDQEALETAVCEGAQRLASMGVDFMAIPANSVHAFFDRITASVQVPVLNIIDETIKRLPEKVGRVALFATRMTVGSRIYQSGLQVRRIECLHPTSIQGDVDALIIGMKNGVTDELRESWKALVARCQGLGAEAILVACTDLTPLAGVSEIPTVDSSKCLAEAAVKTYLGA